MAVGEENVFEVRWDRIAMYHERKRGVKVDAKLWGLTKCSE